VRDWLFAIRLADTRAPNGLIQFDSAIENIRTVFLRVRPSYLSVVSSISDALTATTSNGFELPGPSQVMRYLLEGPLISKASNRPGTTACAS
jgi:hypothetical protein